MYHFVVEATNAPYPSIVSSDERILQLSQFMNRCMEKEKQTRRRQVPACFRMRRLLLLLLLVCVARVQYTLKSIGGVRRAKCGARRQGGRCRRRMRVTGAATWVVRCL